MNYRARRHWPSLLGIGGGALLFVLAMVLGAPLLLGVTIVAVTVAIGLGGQLSLENRSGIVRERRLVVTAADLRAATAELERLATVDPLTGVANRRAFFAALGAEFRRAQRYGHNLSVVMIDIDDFKRLNDEAGHMFGDYVLGLTAQTIAENTRESDLVARYGGEEFVVMLPETDEAGAVAVAEKLLRAVEAVAYRPDESSKATTVPYHVTISVGLACGPVLPPQDETELLRRADEALYAAKRAGKNRVHRWTNDELADGAQTSR